MRFLRGGSTEGLCPGGCLEFPEGGTHRTSIASGAKTEMPVIF